MNIPVPTPSTILSRKLNTTNNVGVGIMDTNLVCVFGDVSVCVSQCDLTDQLFPSKYAKDNT